jgi:phage-related protein
MATKKVVTKARAKSPFSGTQKKVAWEELPEKPIKWMGDSLKDLKALPSDVVSAIGFQLHVIQHGLEPDNWSPMPTVGSGATEIRFKDKDGWYRVIYVAKFESAIYVLHSFQKKTNATSQQDIDLASDRYKLAKKDNEGSKK